MFFVDQFIFFASVLILVGILSHKFSARFGIPVLVLFLLVGMLAGEEGIGGISFEDYELAHGFGTFALAVILFDGGLRTPFRILQASWKPALSLATLGVLITSITTGLYVSWLFDLSPLYGILLGSIVGSTDAAAVFSILRSAGFNLDERLEATLEVESGSNDPMAIFLTIGMIEVLTGERTVGLGLITLFVMQIGQGGLIGYGVGRLAAWLIARINLNAAGLYPVLVITLGLATYGIAAVIGGSGFLAVYIAGIVIGNSRLIFQRGTFLFHDGLAYVCQIAMFVLLGLLSYPSALLSVAWQGLAVASFLMFIARPTAVFVSLIPFGFSIRELAFVSWVGLKGAVPIILATYPLLFGVPESQLLFNVVFFVVLVSALLQGWTLPTVAGWLRLRQPRQNEPAVSLDITSLQHLNADIVSYEIRERSAAAHLRISELGLPEDAVIALVARGSEIIPARGPTVLLPADHVFVLVRNEIRDVIDGVFAESRDEVPSVPLRAGIYVPQSLQLRELDVLYGIMVDGDHGESIGAFMERQTGRALTEGDYIEIGDLRFFVPSQPGGTIDRIGIEEKR
jgi:potassium/hydrogen antiporter